MREYTTITFDDDIPKLKELENSETLSANNIVREECNDLQVFEERKNEETISYASLLKKLQGSGKL